MIEQIYQAIQIDFLIDFLFVSITEFVMGTVCPVLGITDPYITLIIGILVFMLLVAIEMIIIVLLIFGAMYITLSVLGFLIKMALILLLLIAGIIIGSVISKKKKQEMLYAK